MLRYLVFIFILISPALTGAPLVPTSMEFAGIKLTINDAARRQIQTDVDALRRSQTYFDRKVEKVEMYFPIIERVFREENVPEDFKYLAIQESALIPDAVSVSNAVGFWQFKDFTAREVGLRVDRYIDERMNITASTHGAAKYLKKNNFFFDNWVYALLAYNTGPGGAEQHIEKKYMGASRMTITGKTHWYVKKFLAHKIAFEEALGKNSDLGLMLYEYNDIENKSLKEISDYFKVDYERLTEYNKWIKKGKVPADKKYTAIIPITANDQYAIRLLNPSKGDNMKDATRPKIALTNNYQPSTDFDFNENDKFPIVKTSFLTKRIKVNGIPGFIASANDKISTVTIDHGITQKKFMKYNEMTSGDEIIEGEVYYLKPKKSKAKIHYHVVIPGETAWSISQKYGIKIKKLLAKNRLREEKNLEAGMVMWLRFIRPADVPVEYRKNQSKNLIVQSSANQIEYPERNPVHDRPDKELNARETTPAITSSSDLTEDAESDFLFEEIDEETEYINENSFIDLNNVEELNEDNSTKNETSIYGNSEPEKNDKKVKKYHIVKTGETLFSISRQYDVSIGKIRQWNDIQDLDVLSVGQTIIIYHDENLQASTNPNNNVSNAQTYTVKKNDTLYSIARQYGLSIKDLMDLNNMNDFDIREGEVLKIKKAE